MRRGELKFTPQEVAAIRDAERQAGYATHPPAAAGVGGALLEQVAVGGLDGLGTAVPLSIARPVLDRTRTDRRYPADLDFATGKVGFSEKTLTPVFTEAGFVRPQSPLPNYRISAKRELRFRRVPRFPTARRSI